MRTSNSIDKIAAALVAIQRELKPVVKSATNPHFNSKFVPYDGIIEHARPICAANEVAIVQGGGNENAANRLSVETMLVHSSGQWISSVVDMPMDKATAQGAGSAMTYGRRYGLAAILSIAADEDDDGNAASQPAKRPPARAKAPAITDEQIDKVTELLLADGSYEKHKGKIKSLTEADAATWITRLTEKLKQ